MPKVIRRPKGEGKKMSLMSLITEKQLSMAADRQEQQRKNLKDSHRRHGGGSSHSIGFGGNNLVHRTRK